MNKNKQIVTAGVLIAFGIILPITFHTFQMGGAVFLPMHIPILLGGFLLSPFNAALVGVLTPILSSVMTSMPPFFPIGIQMVFELACYGYIISYIYKRRSNILISLIMGMLAGRLVAGIVNYILLTQFLAKAFSIKTFLTASFITSLPGILIQIVVIPIMVKLLENANILESKGVNINEAKHN